MSIIQTVKEVVELVQKADNIDLMRQVLRLQTEIGEMAEENRKLKDEIRTLRHTADIREKLQFKGNSYFLPAKNGTTDGPYCQRCFDVDGKLIREKEGATRGYYFCRECELQSARNR